MIPAKTTAALCSLVVACVLCFGNDLAVLSQTIPAESQSKASATDDGEILKSKIAEIQTAYGGFARLQELANKPFVINKLIKSAAPGSNTDVVQIAVAPDKLYSSTNVNDKLTLAIVCNYKTTTGQIGDSQILLSPAVGKDLKEIALITIFPGLIFDNGGEVTLEPSAALNSRPCDLFSVAVKNGRHFQIWVDKETHLIAQLVYDNQQSQFPEPKTTTITYADYKQVSGVMIPFGRTYDSVDGKAKLHSTITSVSFETKDSDFELPATISHTMPASSLPVTVPLESSADAPIVKAQFNNNYKYGMLIAPSSDVSLVDNSIASYIGDVIPASDFGITATDAFSGIVILPKVTIGGLTLENVTAIVAKLPPANNMMNVECAGMFGANVLKSFSTTIDNQKHVLTFSDPEALASPAGAQALPFNRVPGGLYTVPISIDGKEGANCILGASSWLNIFPADVIVKAQPELKVFLASMNSSGSTGSTEQPISLRLVSLALAKQTFANPICTIVPPSYPGASSLTYLNQLHLGTIGNSILRNFNMMVNYKQNRLVLVPIAEKIERLQLLGQLDHIDRQFLVNKNIDSAISAYGLLSQQAHAKSIKDVEALAIAKVADAYNARYLKNNDSKLLSQIVAKYQLASDLATASGNKQAQASILADWANVYFQLPGQRIDINQDTHGAISYDIRVVSYYQQGNNDDYAAAQAENNAKLNLSRAGVALINKALALNILEPAVSVVNGRWALADGRWDLAGKCINQALLLQPDNYQALVEQYRLAKTLRNAVVQKDAISKLKLYYPNVPEVLTLTTASTRH